MSSSTPPIDHAGVQESYGAVPGLGTALATRTLESRSVALARQDPLMAAVDALPKIYELAAAMVASGLMPRAIRTPEQAMAVMLTGREMGLGPMQSIRSINIIDAKPVVAADLQLALFKGAGGRSTFSQLDDKGATIHLRHPNGDEHVESFSIDDARAAQLLTKDNWKKHPRAMLRSRVITAALKSIGFEATTGVYDPDEADHFKPGASDAIARGEDPNAVRPSPQSGSATGAASATTRTRPAASASSARSRSGTLAHDAAVSSKTDSTTGDGTTRSASSTTDEPVIYLIHGGGEVSRYRSRYPNGELQGVPLDAIDGAGDFLIDATHLDAAGSLVAGKLAKDSLSHRDRWQQLGDDLIAEDARRKAPIPTTGA